LLALLALPVVALLVCLWAGSGGPLKRANFDRIEVGMTLDEVTDILGPHRPGPRFMLINGGPSPLELATWSSFGASVAVYVDTGGRIRAKQYHEITITDRLRELWYRAFRRAAPF
jgi:hypothetical protein